MTLEERNAKLDEAKALILKGWCQNSLAQDENNSSVDMRAPEAVKFCILGAIYRIGFANEIYSATKNATQALGFGDLMTTYNNAPGRTKYEVAAIFDHAKEQPL